MRSIRLAGPDGNMGAGGSRISLIFGSSRQQSHEICAGGGYWSQSSTKIFIPSADELQNVDIRWPDGTEKTITGLLNFEAGAAVISY